MADLPGGRGTSFAPSCLSRRVKAQVVSRLDKLDSTYSFGRMQYKQSDGQHSVCLCREPCPIMDSGEDEAEVANDILTSDEQNLHHL
jgi:hypothetical protein